MHSRTRRGINYPYIFPDEKEIEDKIPTVNIDNFSGFDGGPYPASSAGPIHTFANTTTYVKGRHTFKAGVVFDTRVKTTSIRSTSARFRAAPTTRTASSRSQQRATARSGLAMADMALGLFTDYAELDSVRSRSGARSRPTSSFRTRGDHGQPDHRRRGPLRDLAAVVFDDQQYRELRSALLRSSAGSDHRLRTGRITGGARYNGVVLAGRRLRREKGTSWRRAGSPGAGTLPGRAARILQDALQRL